MRNFKELTQIEAQSGDFDIKRDWKSFSGVALRKRLRSKIYPLDENFTVVMYESYPLHNNNYNLLLNDIIGPDVLFLGGGINLLAKGLEGEGFLMDCVEIEQDIVNLMQQDLFNNLFVADAETYTPTKQYDCIIMDIFETKENNYQQRRESLKNKYLPYLKSNGKYLELDF